jgi:hypothetical protein
MAKYFFTGIGRSGTHSFAKAKAEVENIEYIDEDQFGFRDYDKLIKLSNSKESFSCQCPFVGEKTLDLAKHGKVYFCFRRDIHNLVQSFRWGVVETFLKESHTRYMEEFPDEPLWEHFQPYDTWFWGEYMPLYAKLLEYMYGKYFSEVAEAVYLEDQPWYDETKMVSYIRKIGPRGKEQCQQAEDLFKKWLPQQ